jgi:C1A family cysteine protease
MDSETHSQDLENHSQDLELPPIIEDLISDLDAIADALEEGNNVNENKNENGNVVDDDDDDDFDIDNIPSSIYLANVDNIHYAELKIKELCERIHTHKLPPIVDLRPEMPPVYNQYSIGSCSANAIVAAYQYDAKNEFYGSRLFCYYNERMIENTAEKDAGAKIMDGIISVKTHGLCSETSWPYIQEKFAEKPPNNCYEEGKNHVAIEVSNIHQDINTMKNWLNLKLPFIVGIMVYEEFQSLSVKLTGMVPMPTETSRAMGGHAVLCCGYTETHWIMRNSWGSKWGDRGYFYIPHNYLLDRHLASDLWVIEKVK